MYRLAVIGALLLLVGCVPDNPEELLAEELAITGAPEAADCTMTCEATDLLNSDGTTLYSWNYTTAGCPADQLCAAQDPDPQPNTVCAAAQDAGRTKPGRCVGTAPPPPPPGSDDDCSMHQDGRSGCLHWP
jgi:hypothetical protein